MHEMSLAEAILQIVEDTAAQQGCRRVSEVRLEIGALSGVEVDALSFCLDVVLKGSVADGARVELERLPGQGYCLSCGEGETRIEGHDHAHPHDHPHTHHHAHDHAHAHAGALRFRAPTRDLHYGLGPAHAHVPGLSQERMVRIEQDILGKNNGYAEGNRKHFAEHGIFAVNLVSSPGSGKTTLLVKTIEMLQAQAQVAVVEGDQQTSHDADRIRATGAPAIQVNTGKGCHLDAHMVGHALERLSLPDDSLLMIENVGNLVCPAAFDLGEAHKVVILSVTEGEDKPLKYPDMFHAADLMILNKVDLLPYLNFDVAQCVEYAHRVNPKLAVMQVSATSGQGMDEWLGWLLAGRDQAKTARLQNVDVLKQRIAELEAQLAAGG